MEKGLMFPSPKRETIKTLQGLGNIKLFPLPSNCIILHHRKVNIPNSPQSLRNKTPKIFPLFSQLDDVFIIDVVVHP